MFVTIFSDVEGKKAIVVNLIVMSTSQPKRDSHVSPLCIHY